MTRMILLMAAMLALLLAFGCDRSYEPTLTEDATSLTEYWVVGETPYATEAEAWDALQKAPGTSGAGCWHWTQDDGRWYVRECGLDLSEQCYTPCGSFGSMCDCRGQFGGGG